MRDRGAYVLLLALLGANASAGPKEDLAELKARIADINRLVAQSEDARAEAADQLRDSERAISDLNRKLAGLSRQRTELGAELAALQSKAAAARRGAGRESERIGELLRRYYIDGRDDLLKLVLAGRSPDEFARRRVYLEAIAHARAASVSNYRSSVAQAQAVQREVAAKATAVAANELDATNSRQSLESERAKQAATLKKVGNDLARQRRELVTLQRNEARLTRLVEELRRALRANKAAKTPPRPKAKLDASRPRADVPSAERIEEAADDSVADRAFAALKGRLKWPVRGELVFRYGSPREDSRTLSKGVFIRTAPGGDVRTVADGRVVYADWLRGFGNLMIVDHGGRYMTLYGNAEALLKDVGDGVRAGEPIARVGATGGSQESGLYFEMRYDGRPFDPLKWIAR